MVVPILAGAVVCHSAGAEGLVQWHEQVVSGVCTLRYAVPEGWTVEAKTPAPGAVALRLTPIVGHEAKVLVTGLAPRAGSPLASRSEIKRATRAMGEALLSGSTEKRIELRRLDGTDGSGFFYTLTDARTPLPEGEFPVMTQGIMAVGALRLAVTVLAQQKDSAASRMTFDLLRTADCGAAR